jgi:hypothetical protein
LFVVVMMLGLPAALLGCGGTVVSSGEGGVDASADGHEKTDGRVKTLTALRVTPAMASIAMGTTQQYTATASFSEGSTLDVSATARWSSSDVATATIDSSGLAAAVRGGSTTITATVTIAGVTKAGTATLTIPGCPLMTISVTPRNPTVPVGVSQQFTATDLFCDGTTQDVTTTATWASSDKTVATIDATGLAFTVKRGTTTISATIGPVTGKTMLTVSDIGPFALVVTPAAAVTAVGGAPVPFTATESYLGGMTANVTTTAAWTSSNPTIATVGAATGIAIPVTLGTTTITAAFGSHTATALLTVGGGPPMSIAVTPATPSIPVGLTQQFKATATLTDGTTEDVTSVASWTSSSIPTATISATGLATGVGSGTSTITATLGTVSGTAHLTVGGPPLPSITVTPNPASGLVCGGGAVQFKATALFTDGTSVDVTTSAAWTSSVPAVATVGAATGLAVPVSVGATTISATYGGSTSTATFVVGGPTLVSVSLTPATPSIHVGTTQQFAATATYSDGTTEDVTASAAWISSSTSIATISSGGLATGVSVATTTITATFDCGGVSKSGTATLTVTP